MRWGRSYYGYDPSIGDRLRGGTRDRRFTFLLGAAIGITMALVSFNFFSVPDYAKILGVPLLFFGVLITLIATPFIIFDQSEGRNSVLTGALGVGWGYSLIEFGTWFTKESTTTSAAAHVIVNLAFKFH